MSTSSILPRRLGDTGAQVSALGFGSAALGNLYRAIDDTQARAAVTAAMSAGITYVDTAPHYGQGLAEQRVGATLAGSQFTLSTKVGRILVPIAPPPPGTERHGFVDGNAYEPEFDYSYDGVMQAYEDSRERLGVPIDILLAHDLGSMTHGDDADRHMRDFLDGGYRAMADLKRAGAVQAIGLGVNEWQVAEAVLHHADLDVVLLAGRYTLLEQTALDSFLPLCTQRRVSVICGGPYNSGILAGDTRYNYTVAPPDVVARVAALNKVCAAHDVPLAAAALQFASGHPVVACVLAGMASAAEVAENVALWSMDIPYALWEDLKTEGLLRADAPVPAAETAARELQP